MPYEGMIQSCDSYHSFSREKKELKLFFDFFSKNVDQNANHGLYAL